MISTHFDGLGEKIKAKLPAAVHSRVDEIIRYVKELAAKWDDPNSGRLIFYRPLYILGGRLESGDISPVNSMKELQFYKHWFSLFEDTVKGGQPTVEEIGGIITAENIDKIMKEYRKALNFGRKLTLAELIERYRYAEAEAERKKQKNDDGGNGNGKYRDIYTGNIIVALSEIIAEIENKIATYIPEALEDLKKGRFAAVKDAISGFSIDSPWARRMVESGKLGRVSIRNKVIEIKKELERDIEIYEILYPIYEMSNVFVAIMPVLYTMFMEPDKKIEEIKTACENIFNEFSFGAGLERLSMVLREKIVKNAPIDEIRITANAAKKLISKLITDLNINVISNLRRMRLQTIIDEDLIKNAEKYGLDLSGLNTKFGRCKVPPDWNELKISSMRKFERVVNSYRKIMMNRLSEEIGNGHRPSLRDMDELIKEVRTRVEHIYQTVIPQMAPLFSAALERLTAVLESYTRFLEPLREKMLNAYLSDSATSERFYNGIKKYYTAVKKEFEFFTDFMELTLAFVKADQNIAVKFFEIGGDPVKHSEAYAELFKKSMNDIKRMFGLKALTVEELDEFKQKLINAINLTESFVKKYTADIIDRILKPMREKLGR